MFSEIESMHVFIEIMDTSWQIVFQKSTYDSSYFIAHILLQLVFAFILFPLVLNIYFIYIPGPLLKTCNHLTREIFI